MPKKDKTRLLANESSAESKLESLTPGKHKLKLKTNIYDSWVSKYPRDSQQCNEIFIGEQKVVKLDTWTFEDFLKKTDVALVFFYDPCDENSLLAQKHVNMAAGMTHRENHAYAAVNCQADPDICDQQGVDGVPFYRMFSKGHTVGTIREYRTFTMLDMKRYVDNCPILEEPVRPKRPCEVKPGKTKKTSK